MDNTQDILEKEQEEYCPKAGETNSMSMEECAVFVKEEADCEDHSQAEDSEDHSQAEDSEDHSQAEDVALNILANCQVIIKEEATDQIIEPDNQARISLESAGESCHVFLQEEASEESGSAPLLKDEEGDPLTRWV